MFPGTKDPRYQLCCFKTSLYNLLLISLILDLFFFLNIFMFIFALVVIIIWKPLERYEHPIVNIYVWVKLILSGLLFLVMIAPIAANATNLRNARNDCDAGLGCGDNQHLVAGIVIPVLFMAFNLLNFIVAIFLFMAYRNWRASSGMMRNSAGFGGVGAGVGGIGGGIGGGMGASGSAYGMGGSQGMIGSGFAQPGYVQRIDQVNPDIPITAPLPQGQTTTITTTTLNPTGYQNQAAASLIQNSL